MSTGRVCEACGQPVLPPEPKLGNVARVVSIAGVVGGVPIIEGTRIPVASIQALAKNRGLDVADIVSLYPYLTDEHVQAALDYRPVEQGGTDE